MRIGLFNVLKKAANMVSIEKSELEDILKQLGLQFSCDSNKGYTRRKHGKGFAYYNENNKHITCENITSRLDKLAIPPSYKEIWYCKTTDGYIQATAQDSTGKKQYFYHEYWRTYRDNNKYRQLATVGNNLPSLRRKMRRDMNKCKNTHDKKYILALMSRLLDKTGIRMGNTKSARENKTFGLTTLKPEHLDIVDSHLVMHYVGKGNMDICREMNDKVLEDFVSDDISENDKAVFTYTDTKGNSHTVHPSCLNNYLKDALGENISAKDLRTWRFSVMFLEESLRQRKLLNNNDSSKTVTLKSVLEKICKKTGNTPAILKESYIHPGLLNIVKEEDWDQLDSDDKIPEINGLLKEERRFAKYLQTRHANTHTSAMNM